jgi:YHS domain-containing protein
MVRHPQYIGLFIALFGEGVVHWPTVFSIALFPVIVIAYVFLARSEERKMLRQFGEVYRTYQQRVPAFIPRWGQWGKVINMQNASTERNMPMKESKVLTKDPVCQMTVDVATALHSERDGKTFYFCSEGCRTKFMSTAKGAEPVNKAGGCCG